MRTVSFLRATNHNLHRQAGSQRQTSWHRKRQTGTEMVAELQLQSACPVKIVTASITVVSSTTSVTVIFGHRPGSVCGTADSRRLAATSCTTWPRLGPVSKTSRLKSQSSTESRLQSPASQRTPYRQEKGQSPVRDSSAESPTAEGEPEHKTKLRTAGDGQSCY